MKAAILTVSDSCSSGQREDRSGAALASLLVEHGWTVVARATVPDEVEAIRKALPKLAEAGAALLVTTGGTGLAPRDVTPEAVRPLLDKEVSGLGELMRRRGLEKTPFAALSRSLAGVYQGRLLLCLPGSEKGARDSLQAVIDVLPHALEITRGSTEHVPRGT